MAVKLRNLLLILSALVPTLAVPTTDPAAAQVPILRESPNLRPASYKSPFQKLRDSVIETIWSVPKKSSSSGSGVRADHAAPANFRTRYDKDVVLRFKITTEDEAKAFSEAAEILYLDIWDVSSDWVDVRIAKAMLPSFLNLLPPSLQNSHVPLMHDLAQSVYDTYPTPSESESWRTRHSLGHHRPHELFFDNYQPLSVLDAWLRLLTSWPPHIAEMFSIGQSAEGRDITAIRIRVPMEEWETADPDAPRETLLIVGGSHAREWISVSTVAYLVHEFIARYNNPKFPILTKVLRNYDLVLIPVLNPDGYEYTWSTDRLWRKSRQQTDLPFCPGIDVDRAFSFGWDGHNAVDNPCTDSFAGEYPFQAVESKLLADWAMNQTKDHNVLIRSFLDMHSYSQKVLYPYSYSCNDRPPLLEDLEEVAMNLAKSFRLTTGHWYGVSSACEGQYVTSQKNGAKIGSIVNNNGGSAIDYFHHDLNVAYSFQIKLRDTGSYGFLLPKENIVPSGREVYEAVLGLGHWLLSNRGIESVGNDGFVTDQIVDEDQSSEDQEEQNASEGKDIWSRKGLASLKGLEHLLDTCKDKSQILPPLDVEIEDPAQLVDDDEWEIVVDEDAMALRWRRR